MERLINGWWCKPVSHLSIYKNHRSGQNVLNTNMPDAITCEAWLKHSSIKTNRGRHRTRPDTPAIQHQRDAARYRYYHRDVFDQWADTTLYNCRRRAETRGVRCTLTLEDLKALLLEFDMICPVIGLDLNFGRGRKHVHPDSITVDCIDPFGPYSRENCVIVSHKANAAMGRLNLDELQMLGEYAKALKAIERVKYASKSLRRHLHTQRADDLDDEV